MSAEQDARLFGLGYRGYEGDRRPPRAAIATLAVFTFRRVLGLGRAGRHNVLPALTLAVAFLPALLSVAIAVLTDELAADELISYGEYSFFIGSALTLYAAVVAPEALCPDRRTGMFGLYLAGPLDRSRYLAAKSAGVVVVMLLMTLGPLFFMLLAYLLAGYGPSAGETPGLIARMAACGIVTAALYTAVALAVSSFTTRRSAAAVGVAVMLLVPLIVASVAIESADAPDQLALLGVPIVLTELSYRLFGERAMEGDPVEALATWELSAGLAAWVVAGAAACWLRYRRLEAGR
jgi:ABC-2 type transport system permease protein